MGIYKQMQLEEMDRDEELQDKMNRLQTLETLVGYYGLCHPDVQVGRLTVGEAMNLYAREMGEAFARGLKDRGMR
jgi:hypothetical protein